MNNLAALIFDLDGVLTDTAEYHYQAWQRLADEEGLPFDRTVNERLRGVSRRESLLIILGDQTVPEEHMQEMMSRKNGYYQEMLEQITSADLLPGVLELLDSLDKARIPYALASASRNAAVVMQRLGIGERFAVLADGSSVQRPKPAPDLFRFAAAQMNVPPNQCLVIEDAAAGIEAALAAGMAALALGPAERFVELLGQDGRLTHRENLVGLTLAELQQTAAYDPLWVVPQTEFVPQAQHHMETVFTIGNGYFASRGSFEEGYPSDSSTTFAHGIYDDMPVVFAELVNLPNWLQLDIAIDQQRFRLDEGQLLHFERHLDLARGLLTRTVRWQAPHGPIIDMTFERFASYTAEHMGALRFLLTAVNQPAAVSLSVGIDGQVANQDLLHWDHLAQGNSDNSHQLWLHSRTRHTKIEVATAMQLSASVGETAVCQLCKNHPQITITAALEAGQTVQIDKLVSYTASRDAVPAAEQVVKRALATFNNHNYDSLKQAHVHAWRNTWDDCDVVIEGDDEAQLALRFNLFQLLVAAPQHDEHASIGAKTLSGYGYRGHVFWDTEIFILPFLIYTKPKLARNMLMYRYHTLAGARRKAAANGFAGAQYAWESTMTGDEMTPTWVPDYRDRTKLIRIWTGDIQIHISADVAYAIMQYWRVTGDDAFVRDYGSEIILDTARFWSSRAEPEEAADGRVRYAYRNVIGPDEYHDHVDNNAFTNRMAQWHLQTALDLLAWLKQTHPEKAAELTDKLELTPELQLYWQDIIENIILHHDPETGVIRQFDDFFERIPVDPAFIAQADKSLQLIFGIEGANERQVLKQADVIMLLCLLRDEYDQKTWQANWDAYMPLTDHRYGSSLGPSMHAWAACEMNRPQEAYEHFMLAARADLRNPRGNAGDGIHAASTGGVWQAAVFGFAGLRLTENGIITEPRLPAHWQRLAFKIYWHGQPHQIDIRQGEE